jgi:hypothetical protein
LHHQQQENYFLFACNNHRIGGTSTKKGVMEILLFKTSEMGAKTNNEEF